MIVSLARILSNNSRLFQQILFDVGSFDDAILVEANVDVLAETRRVVITHRLSVAEGWKRTTGIKEKRKTKTRPIIDTVGCT